MATLLDRTSPFTLGSTSTPPGREVVPANKLATMKPRIEGETYKDIRFQPSQADLERVGPEGTQDLWREYDRLNEEFQNEIKTTGMTSSDPKQAAAAFLQRQQPATGPGMLARPEEMPTRPNEKQEPTSELAPVRGGEAISPPETTIAGKVARSQAQKRQTPPPTDAATSVAKTTSEDLESKLRAGKPISRGDLLDVLNQIKEVKIDSPELSEADKNNFIQARAMAYQAYKEKADRNEWLDVAQNLTNALATFAAGRGGSAYRGLSLPSTDYGARTAQALREYESATGAIGEQERALERDVERRGRQATQAADLQRRGLEDVLKLGESAISAQEREAAQRRDIATKLEIATAKKEAADAKADALRIREAKEAEEKGRGKQVSFLEKDIDHTKFLISQATKELDAANEVVAAEDNKSFSKALNNFLAASGQPQATFEKKGMLWGTDLDKEAAKNAAKQHAATKEARIKELNERLANSMMKQEALMGGAPASQPTPAPSNQPPTQALAYQPGDVIEQGGKRYRFKGGDASNPANYEEVR